MLPTGKPFFAVAALFALAGIPSVAAAQPGSADAPAPSLAVPTDPDLPHYALAITADPLAAFFGDYGLRIEGTVGAAHALFARPSYIVADTDALSLEVGYHLFFLGEGLDGGYLGPALGVAVTTERALAVSASVEAGWQWVWDGLVLGIAGGATFVRGEQASVIVPRVVISLGYAWM
jgi:hypothetical protein